MLTLQYVPYAEIAALQSQHRIEKLLSIVREDSIVVMEGQLTKQEETNLIKQTMEEINDKFKGIEIATIDPFSTDTTFIDRLRQDVVHLFLGQRRGMTIIGPATVVKRIKQDPQRIYLFTQDKKTKKRSKKAAKTKRKSSKKQ